LEGGTGETFFLKKASPVFSFVSYLKFLIALQIAMTATPTSANTAAQSEA
jgi:hypothetical protein